MKHPLLLTTLSLFALSNLASAQNRMRIPDPFASLKPSQQKALKDQAAGFFNSAKPAVSTAAKSTVAISYRNNRIAYGTVVNIPRTTSKDTRPAILTKWSEVSNARTRLVVTTPDGKQHSAQVTGVYPDHDLALLTVDAKDTKLVPLDLSDASTPELGNFILLARPDGNVEGFGVVSVKARSLRESDKAYLGVMMDFASAGKDGVPLKQVMPKSAASKAGLRDGDIIISIDQANITGAMEMRNLLQRLVPGSEITVRYRRGTVEKDTTVSLGSRADTQDIRRVPRERMEKMQRMGTVPSSVRSNFPNVIQSDMPINPDDAGAPVVDLDGNIVGLAIARGSRIKSFIIPTSTIQKVLTTKPKYPSDALTKGANTNRRQNPNYGRNPSRGSRSAPTPPAPRAVPTNDDDAMDKVRRLLDEAKRNNDENAENLRKIEDALRKMNQDRKNDR